MMYHRCSLDSFLRLANLQEAWGGSTCPAVLQHCNGITTVVQFTFRHDLAVATRPNDIVVALQIEAAGTSPIKMQLL